MLLLIVACVDAPDVARRLPGEAAAKVAALDADWAVEGDVASRYLGLAAGSGDMNGDGYEDLILGSQ